MRNGGVKLRTGVAALLLVVSSAAAGVDPSTRPATTRPGDRTAAIERSVKNLADTDPDVRDKARLELMGLDRAGLDALRAVVAANRPLGPGQVVALQEVVNQVYLAAEQDEAAEGAGGFLGVQVAPSGIEVTPAPGVRPEAAQVGVAVAARVPGFCGYRVLEDGDVILRLTSDKAFDFRNPTDLSAVVSRQHPGDTVTLDVLRRGKVIQLQVTLDRKPAWVGQMMPAEAMGPRQRRASEYWDQTFAPLLEGRTS